MGRVKNSLQSIDLNGKCKFQRVGSMRLKFLSRGFKMGCEESLSGPCEKSLQDIDLSQAASRAGSVWKVWKGVGIEDDPFSSYSQNFIAKVKRLTNSLF